MENNDEIEEVEEVEAPKAPLPIKKKRVMSEKQLEALARGRAKGVEKLKQKGAMTKQVVESKKMVQKIKEEEKVDTIEDIKKINDLNYIRKTTEELMNRFSMVDANIKNVESKFNGYLTEREERKKMKDNNIVEKTIKQQLPKTMNDMMYKEKIQKEMKSNPFYGRL